MENEVTRKYRVYSEEGQLLGAYKVLRNAYKRMDQCNLSGLSAYVAIWSNNRWNRCNS